MEVTVSSSPYSLSLEDDGLQNFHRHLRSLLQLVYHFAKFEPPKAGDVPEEAPSAEVSQ